MATLTLKNINKIYPSGVLAVRDFNMQIEHGEFVVLVGPSGCGKSTMLRMIAGLETITDGDMILDDIKINRMAPSDRNIAMVFQNYALFHHLTVYENMGITLAIKHVNGDDIHSRVMKAADIVELKGQLNRKPKKLSGGQRQRVALGRSIVRDPQLFLMDEPLSNLDAKLRTQTRKELVLLHNRLGATFIYVTHDQVEAMTMADRIVIMNEGVVQQIGTPTQVYQKPANMFVGGFIGSPTMNFIEGTMKDDTFVGDTIKLPIPEEMACKLAEYDGEKVIIGIRPEAFDIAAVKDDSLRCKIDVVEFMGYEYIVSFTMGTNEVYKAKIDARNVRHELFGEILLTVDMDKVHFFNPDSKIRIA